jgi:hypothetical protein
MQHQQKPVCLSLKYMCHRVEFNPRHPDLHRFHDGPAENWIERHLITRGFHGKGLLFSLFPAKTPQLAYAGLNNPMEPAGPDTFRFCSQEVWV